MPHHTQAIWLCGGASEARDPGRASTGAVRELASAPKGAPPLREVAAGLTVILLIHAILLVVVDLHDRGTQHFVLDLLAGLRRGFDHVRCGFTHVRGHVLAALFQPAGAAVAPLVTNLNAPRFGHGLV